MIFLLEHIQFQGIYFLYKMASQDLFFLNFFLCNIFDEWLNLPSCKWLDSNPGPQLSEVNVPQSAAKAHWIRLRLPPAVQASNPLFHLSLNFVLYLSLYQESDNNKQKRGRVGQYFNTLDNRR